MKELVKEFAALSALTAFAVMIGAWSVVLGG